MNKGQWLPRFPNWLRKSMAWVCVCLWLSGAARAQGGLAEARVTSVRGAATLTNGASATITLIRGALLDPGNVIDTRGGGRVVVLLSDGSQVTIYPGSRVILKNFRIAGSVRELLDILAGQVRCKIYHPRPRPNPYRVNSPAASIVVRGTDFLVSVETTGATQVVVYEGSVEVASLANPQQRTLVEPGRSIIVRPGGDIGLLSPGPGSELNATAKLDFGGADPLNEIYGGVTQFLDSQVGALPEPVPARYAAFADLHFDSLDNPAYAAGFERAEGRIFLLPSLSASREIGRSLNPSFNDSVHTFDNTLAGHASYFAPLGRTRFVLGGGASVVRSDLQGLRIMDFQEGDSSLTALDRSTAVLATSQTALILARRFGNGDKTSLGLKLEYQTGRGSAANTLSDNYSGLPFTFRLEQRVDAERRSLRAGWRQDFAGGRQLGLFLRVGSSSVSYTELDKVNDGRQPGFLDTFLGEERHARRFAEVGVRWRSPLTRRFFYGLEGALLHEWGRSKGGVTDLLTGDKTAGFSRVHTERATLTAGFGYAPRPRAFLAFDLTGGVYRNINRDADPRPGDVAIRARANFLTLHVGGQSDVWRGLFVNGSLLTTKRWPARFSSEHTTRQFANLGVGWRFGPRLLAQYLFSTNFGNATPSHTLILRCAFNFTEGR